MLVYELKNKEIISPKNFLLEENCLYLIMVEREEIKEILDRFSFHSDDIFECFNQEDTICHESYEQYDFLSLVLFSCTDLPKSIDFTEINIFVSGNYMITVCKDVRMYHQIKLLYEQILEEFDSSVDDLNKVYYKLLNFYLETIFSQLQIMEDKIIRSEETVIHHLQKLDHMDIILLRRNTGKLKREMRPILYLADSIILNENLLISKKNMHYFQNIYIRINKLFDFIEDIYGLSDKLSTAYDSQISMRTNELINKLTSLSVILAPLTVITGIYGMNFRFMPELKSPYAYPIVLCVMFIISMGLYLYIRRQKKW